jgi:hypothetical protein
MGFWTVKEPVEYYGEVSKTRKFFSLIILSALSLVFAYVVLAILIPSEWKEFTDFENGKNIKNHWMIWALYDFGGKRLVCLLWGFFGGFMLYCGIITLKELFKIFTTKK